MFAIFAYCVLWLERMLVYLICYREMSCDVSRQKEAGYTRDPRCRYLFEPPQQLRGVHGAVHGQHPEAVSRQQSQQAGQAGLPAGCGAHQYGHPAHLHTLHQGLQGPQHLVCDGQGGIQGHRGPTDALQDGEAHL